MVKLAAGVLPLAGPHTLSYISSRIMGIRMFICEVYSIVKMEKLQLVRSSKEETNLQLNSQFRIGILNVWISDFLEHLDLLNIISQW